MTDAETNVPDAWNQIESERLAWDEIAESLLGPGAGLVSISRFIGDSRIYGNADRIAKIRSKRSATPEYHNSLAEEASILRDLGWRAEYGERGSWEFLLQDKVEGTPFSQHLFEQQSSAFGLLEKARVLFRLIPILSRLHGSGISHGDLRPDNIMIGESGNVWLIDFDRATRSSSRRASLRDWLGIDIGLTAGNPYWKLALFTLVPKLQSLSHRVRFALKGPSPVVSGDPSTQDLQTLLAAWRLAQVSNANAPGQSLAYYAMTYKGCHFIGERPWYLRWEKIDNAIDFSGKTMLELGCNMGLLSAFASLSGAKSATGVDHDATIVQAARLVADGLDARADFHVVDLAADDDWETRFAGRDIVTALSVVHWLPDQERVLKFLGQHLELLYEGHDPLEVETERLRSLGFTDIQVVMETERDRQVLYARKPRAMAGL